MNTDIRWHTMLEDHVSTLAWSPDGRVLAVGSLGGDALLLDPASGEPMAKLAAHPMGVLALDWSIDGCRLAVGGQDGCVRLYDPTGGEIAGIDVGGWVADVAWSTGASRLAVAAGRTLRVIDPQGALLRTFEQCPSTITSVVWCTNGERIGVGAYGGLRWFDPDRTKASALKTFDWKGSLLSVIVSPNGRWACAGAQDSSIHLWRLWSGKDLSMSGYPTKIEHLAFRHDSRWMASACLGELTIWDFGGRGPAGTRPAQGEAHDRHITGLGWQPGGDLLVSGGADGRLAWWPTPCKQGQELKPVHTHDAEIDVSCLAWAPHGARLAVGRGDGTVEIHDVS